MLTRRLLAGTGLAAIAAVITGKLFAGNATVETPGDFKVSHSAEEWRKLLTPAQFSVLRDHGTESPGSSPLDHETRDGTFACAGCRKALFSSATKYNSGTGWPSFWAPLEGAVGTSSDTALFMTRVEVHCSECGGHLGHVFDDGPPPTNKRYCMNGVAMLFQPAIG